MPVGGEVQCRVVGRGGRAVQVDHSPSPSTTNVTPAAKASSSSTSRKGTHRDHQRSSVPSHQGTPGRFELAAANIEARPGKRTKLDGLELDAVRAQADDLRAELADFDQLPSARMHQGQRHGENRGHTRGTPMAIHGDYP